MTFVGFLLSVLNSLCASQLSLLLLFVLSWSLSLTVPASLWGAGEGGREMLVAPGSGQSPRAASPVSGKAVATAAIVASALTAAAAAAAFTGAGCPEVQ